MKYLYDPSRKVGEESLKTYEQKIYNGFFDQYMSGKGAEIGYAGYIPEVVPILENCDGYDLNTLGYDGKTIPKPDEYYSYLYASHVLEHIADYVQAIQEWHRVVKPNGYIIILVPHKDLYEKKERPPSQWNADHKRFYSTSKLISEIEESLNFDQYRIRYLRENDDKYDYTIPSNIHSEGGYEIEIVLEKLK